MTEFNLKYSPSISSIGFLLMPLNQSSIRIIAPQIFRDFPLSLRSIIPYSWQWLWFRLFGILPWAAPPRTWTDRVTALPQLSQSRSLVAISWGIWLVCSGRGVLDLDAVSAIANQIQLSLNPKVVLSSLCIRLGSIVDVALSLFPVGSGVFEVIILIHHFSSVVWWSVDFVVCNISWIENDASAPRVLVGVDSYSLGQWDNSDYRNKFHFN